MIRVLVVDDSAVVRKVLTAELNKYEDIEVVGSAVDPYVAREKIVRLRPDVVTLDIEMPRMNGLAFLAKLMKHYPLPVIIVSSLAPQQSEAAVRALTLGAVEVVCKPGSQYSVPDVARDLVRAIRVAATVQVAPTQEAHHSAAVQAPTVFSHLETTHKVLAIGASTGGTKVIEAVLRQLPATTPGTVILQHMPVMNGLEATAAICAREQTQGGHIPIVALTANAMQGDEPKCLDAGMDAYIAKPFKVSDVIAMIETLVPQEPEDELSCMEDAPSVAVGPDAEHGAGVTLDWQDGLERVDGDEELYNDILAVFCGDAHRQVTAIEQALCADDLPAIEHEAHAIKGAAANIGALRLAEVARCLEHAAQQHEYEVLAQRVDHMAAAYTDLVRLLEEREPAAVGDPPPPVPTVDAPPSDALTILVVDDMPINVSILVKALAKEGYVVLTAHDGPHGRHLATTYQPDLIILDVMMPDENGFEVMRRLKDDDRTASIPVIFLTGKDDGESKVEGFALGAVDYITKPFYPPEVKARVHLHLKLHRATNALLDSQAAKLKQLHEAQSALLLTPDQLPEARFGIYYDSLYEAGGDFYDVLRISRDIFGYFVADVSGHDIQTGFLTSALKALLQQNSAPIYTPTETLRMMNRVLLDVLPSEKFLTACYARLNRASHTMTIINAGQPPVVYLPQNGDPRLIELGGDVLGAFPQVCHEQLDVSVEEGDRFFLYSDGLIERPGKRQTWPQRLPELLACCSQMHHGSITDAATRLTTLIQEPGEQPEDDVVVLGIEV